MHQKSIRTIRIKISLDCSCVEESFELGLGFPIDLGRSGFNFFLTEVEPVLLKAVFLDIDTRGGKLFMIDGRRSTACAFFSPYHQPLAVPLAVHPLQKAEEAVQNEDQGEKGGRPSGNAPGSQSVFEAWGDELQSVH